MKKFVAVRRADLLGWSAILGSALYVATDVLEAAQGGFGPLQLWLTLVAEAAIPVVVLGIAIEHRARIGGLGLVGASLYAYSYVYFTGTVIYALAHRTPDYAALGDALQPWMTIHGGVMVAGGLTFGGALLRGGLASRWPPVAVMAGVVLVAATQTAPDGIQVLAAGIRALGIAGLGLATMRPTTFSGRGTPGGGRWGGAPR
ncbi:MAG: hypothetical protein Q7T55_17740 [Solirubrobacteraceae bacterium]|nr:hypothetical protein [Solirubrobacteraceae bacterium]